MNRNLTWLAGLTIVFAVGCASKKKMDEPTSKTADQKTEVKKSADKAQEKATEKTGKTAKCTNSGDVRTIEIKADGKGCQVLYTKFGTENSVASSSFGTEHCEKVLTKIEDNLTKAGFKCE
jgi:hypothetical protein